MRNTRFLPLAASALLGAAALAGPALAQRGGGGTMERSRTDGSAMTGGRMGRRCGSMMRGMGGGDHGGRPNQQWRRGAASAPDRG